MIAFVAAEAREFAGLERRLTGLTALPWPVDFARSGRLDSRKVLMLADGPGPGRARAALSHLNAADLDAVVSTGFCGGLSGRLGPCQPFVADSVNGIAAGQPARHPECAVGPLVSLDRVVGSTEEKRLLAQSGYDAVEMEAAAVAEFSSERFPFFCVRVVTDTVEESFPIDFNEMRDNRGRFSRVRIIAAAARNPVRLFPALIELDRRSRRAAQVLGDFIADCQF